MKEPQPSALVKTYMTTLYEYNQVISDLNTSFGGLTHTLMLNDYTGRNTESMQMNAAFVTKRLEQIAQFNKLNTEIQKLVERGAAEATVQYQRDLYEYDKATTMREGE